MLRKFSNRPVKILLFVLLALLCVKGISPAENRNV